MFIVSNSDKYGQFYFDDKNLIVYNCRFKRPSPENERAPYIWILILFILIIFPMYFVWNISIYILPANIFLFLLQIAFANLHMKKEKKKIVENGIAYDILTLDTDSKHLLKERLLRGQFIFCGIFSYFFNALLTAVLLGTIVFLLETAWVLSINLLLCFLELWGYNLYFSSKKRQAKLIRLLDK